MTKLIGISGSLRRGSFNTALLRAAAELVPEGVELKVETVHGIPLYDGDVEAAEGIPEGVRTLKDAIVASDGLVLATPEYNNSMSGVLKNAVDWLSRPPADIPRVFRGKPVALMGASPGNFGTILSQSAWLPVFRTLGVNFWSEGRLVIPRAQAVFAQDGRIADEKIRDQVREFMAGFGRFAAASARARQRS
jgi:NAD(P)H-dependent FMN reductase